MEQQIKLKSDEVNSGTDVKFNGSTLTYAWRNTTRATPLTSKFDIAEAQITGYENPRITITGFIDTDSDEENIVTQSLLQDFAKVKYDGTDAKSIYLSVSTGRNSTFIKDYTHTNNYIKVVIENFNLTIDAADSDFGHLWRYTINLVETK